MATSAAPPIDERLADMVAQIHRLIPSAEVRLFGSHARAQADRSVDLVLHSCSEANRRAQEPGSLVQEPFRHGVLFDGKT